jgi:hypothetical protein
VAINIILKGTHQGTHLGNITARFGLIWFSGFRGEDLNVIIYQKKNHLKIFLLKTTRPISTKLCLNDPWVVLFQNCVRQHRPVSKMATVTKNRNFFKWLKLPTKVWLQLAQWFLRRFL